MSGSSVAVFAASRVTFVFEAVIVLLWTTVLRPFVEGAGSLGAAAMDVACTVRVCRRTCCVGSRGGGGGSVSGDASAASKRSDGAVAAAPPPLDVRRAGLSFKRPSVLCSSRMAACSACMQFSTVSHAFTAA